MADVGPSQEDYTEGGGGAGRIGEVTSRGDTGVVVVVVLVRNLGIIGANGAEA